MVIIFIGAIGGLIIAGIIGLFIISADQPASISKLDMLPKRFNLIQVIARGVEFCVLDL